jgi:hypothetical protein
VSAHPPVAGQDVAKLIEFAGASSLTLTFDARSCTDPTTAWVTVYTDATRSVTIGEPRYTQHTVHSSFVC